LVALFRRGFPNFQLRFSLPALIASKRRGIWKAHELNWISNFDKCDL